MEKSSFWRLRESRKWKKVVFGVCGIPASMIENTGSPRARRIATATERLPLNHRTMTQSASSDGRFHAPDEGAEAELVGALVEGAEGLQQTGDEVGVNDGQDGLVHRGPGVRPEVWIARLGTASGDLSKGRVSAAVEVGQQRENVFVVGLIAGYEYSFHKGVSLWVS